MTLNEQIVAFVTEYLQQIARVYPDGDDGDGAAELKLVLRIFRHSLKNQTNKVPVSFETLAMYKSGRRQADALLKALLVAEAAAFVGWVPGDDLQNEQQQCALILGEAIAGLDLEINRQEGAYPELKFALDRERTEYFQMMNEAEEALEF